MSRVSGSEHEGKYAELVALVQGRASSAAGEGGMLEGLLKKVSNPAEEDWTTLAQELAAWALHADKQELESAALGKVGARMRRERSRQGGDRRRAPSLPQALFSLSSPEQCTGCLRLCGSHG